MVHTLTEIRPLRLVFESRASRDPEFDPDLPGSVRACSLLCSPYAGGPCRISNGLNQSIRGAKRLEICCRSMLRTQRQPKILRRPNIPLKKETPCGFSGGVKSPKTHPIAISGGGLPHYAAEWSGRHATNCQLVHSLQQLRSTHPRHLSHNDPLPQIRSKTRRLAACGLPTLVETRGGAAWIVSPSTATKRHRQRQCEQSGIGYEVQQSSEQSHLQV